MGDFYLDESTGNYYVKTDETTWSLEGSLMGPAVRLVRRALVELLGRPAPPDRKARKVLPARPEQTEPLAPLDRRVLPAQLVRMGRPAPQALPGPS